MYKVIKLFADLKDGGHIYNPGDVYPRRDVEVSAERIEELSGSENKRGEPLIELIPEESTEGTNEELPEELPEDAPEAPIEEKPVKAAKKTAKK